MIKKNIISINNKEFDKNIKIISPTSKFNYNVIPNSFYDEKNDSITISKSALNDILIEELFFLYNDDEDSVKIQVTHYNIQLLVKILEHTNIVFSNKDIVAIMEKYHLNSEKEAENINNLKKYILSNRQMIITSFGHNYEDFSLSKIKHEKTLVITQSSLKKNVELMLKSKGFNAHMFNSKSKIEDNHDIIIISYANLDKFLDKNIYPLSYFKSLFAFEMDSLFSNNCVNSFFNPKITLPNKMKYFIYIVNNIKKVYLTLSKHHLITIMNLLNNLFEVDTIPLNLTMLNKCKTIDDSFSLFEKSSTNILEKKDYNLQVTDLFKYKYEILTEKLNFNDTEKKIEDFSKYNLNHKIII
jgi:hypothetical protein